MKVKLFLFCIIQFLYTNAQTTFKGNVHTLNNDPIAFVNIGILEKGVGTVCDDKGFFTLQVPDSLMHESITFNHINYDRKTIPLLQLQPNSMNNIVLESRSFSLSEVIVIPRKQKLKWTKKGLRIPGYAESTNLGEELGVYLNMKEKSIITKCKFTINSCTYDSIVYRVNFYSDMNKDSINPSYSKCITVIKNKKKKDYELDILIQVEQDANVFFSLACVQFHGIGNVKLPIYIGKSYYRGESMDMFDEFPVRPGFSLQVCSAEN